MIYYETILSWAPRYIKLQTCRKLAIEIVCEPSRDVSSQDRTTNARDDFDGTNNNGATEYGTFDTIIYRFILLVSNVVICICEQYSIRMFRLSATPLAGTRGMRIHRLRNTRWPVVGWFLKKFALYLVRNLLLKRDF